MIITNFATGNRNINDNAIDECFLDLEERNPPFLIVEPNFEDALNVDTDIVLNVVSAITNLDRLNRTLSNLNVDNDLDQEILFEVFRACIRGDNLSHEHTKQYFEFVAKIDRYYDKFAYITDESDSSKIDFRPHYSIDFHLLGRKVWLDNTDRYAQNIDDFFNLRFSYISNEIDFSELVKRLDELN